MQNYQDVLNAPSSYFRFPGPSDSGSVITSLRLYSTYAFGLGFIHSENTSGFNRMEYTVPGSGLQALSTQEGLSGRVITAVSYDGVNATVFSYGWTGDPSTVYETDVEFATIDTATSLAQKLAAQGYIITASSSTGAADGSGVILIGTRVQGDTKPRPVLIGDSLSGTDDALLAQGYAIVAVVQKYQDNTLTLFNYIGER